jgi:hypothetical protein
VEITSLTRHILEMMVSKFSNIMININKVIGNRSTFLSGGVTLCTQNVKYFCHLSIGPSNFFKFGRLKRQPMDDLSTKF